MLWATRLDRTETSATVSRGSPRPATRTPAQRRDRERPPAERGNVTIGPRSVSAAGGWMLTFSASHNSWTVRIRRRFLRGGVARLGNVGRREPEGNAGDHDPGLEQEPGPESQSALVVQQVLPPVAHDILGDEDGHDVAGAFTVQVGDVLDHGSGDISERGVKHRQRHRYIALHPVTCQPVGLRW